MKYPVRKTKEYKKSSYFLMVTFAITKPECWDAKTMILVADSPFHWTHQHGLVSNMKKYH